MVKKFSRLLALTCIFIMCFTTCAFASDYTTLMTDVSSQIKMGVQSSAAEYVEYDQEELEFISNNALGFEKKMADSFLSYLKNGSLGQFVSMSDVEVQKESDEHYVATIKLQYEKATVTAEYDFKVLLGQLRLADVNVSLKGATDNSSFVAVMAKAGQNTLIGISVVFCMLAFMSIIIAQFKHVNTFEKWLTERKNKNAEPAGVMNAVSQISDNEANAMDDLELVAVITAAIAASEGGSSDGFTVRSIRRVRF